MPIHRELGGASGLRSGRSIIGIDMKSSYCDEAEQRILRRNKIVEKSWQDCVTVMFSSGGYALQKVEGADKVVATPRSK